MRKHGLPSTDRPHDKYFKAVFSIREVALEMLEFVLPPAIWSKIKIRSLAPASDSFVIFAKPLEGNDIVRFLFEATLMYLQSVTSITRKEYQAMVTEQLPVAYKKEALTLYEQIQLDCLMSLHNGWSKSGLT